MPIATTPPIVQSTSAIAANDTISDKQASENITSAAGETASDKPIGDKDAYQETTKNDYDNLIDAMFLDFPVGDSPDDVMILHGTFDN